MAFEKKYYYLKKNWLYSKKICDPKLSKFELITMTIYWYTKLLTITSLKCLEVKLNVAFKVHKQSMLTWH